MKIGTGYPGNAADETMTFGYNGLKQLIKRTSPSLQLDYTYRTISGNRVSSQVSSLKYTLKNSSGTKTKEKSLNYTYDKMGNIKKGVTEVKPPHILMILKIS